MGDVLLLLEQILQNGHQVKVQHFTSRSSDRLAEVSRKLTVHELSLERFENLQTPPLIKWCEVDTLLARRTTYYYLYSEHEWRERMVEYLKSYPHCHEQLMNEHQLGPISFELINTFMHRRQGGELIADRLFVQEYNNTLLANTAQIMRKCQ